MGREKGLADYPHCAAGFAYARDVVSGRVVAGHLVKLACQRQLDDLEAWQSGDRPDWEFRYDKAEEVCEFIEKLRHVKGQWAKRRLTIKLRPWQQFGIVTFYGWYQNKPWACLQCDEVAEEGVEVCPACGEDAIAGGWLRRYRTCYEEIARKNAKTTKGSGLQLYALTEEGEAGAEVYSAATGSDQARISFDIARQMSLKDEDFCEHFGLEPRAHNLNVLRSGSKMEPLSSETKGLDGKNPSFALIDEYHAHPNNGVVSAMETGMGAREQPVLWIVTTAGFNRAGPCFAMRSYAVKVLERTLEDDSFFSIIYTLDEDDDPLEDPSCWVKANPNLGVSVFPNYLESKVEQAKADPIKQTEVLTKNFNMWLSAEKRLINMVAWDRCGDAFEINGLKGKPCWVGVDMASTQDMAATAMVWDIDGEHFVKMRYYLPREMVMEHAHSTNAHYAGWAAEGLITLTSGNSIDFERIMEDLRDLPSQGFNVQEIAFDPWRATEMVTKLQEAGAVAVEVPNNARSFSEPTKKIIGLVSDGKLHHGGDKILAWHASNVVGHYDNKDNVYPKKERRSEKIDGFIALVLAETRVIRHQAAPRSRWEDEDATMAYAE